MKNKQFYNYDHIRQYLSGSVIMWGTEPIFVDAVDIMGENKYKLSYTRLSDGKRYKNDILFSDDGRLDYTSVPLGMVNWEPYAYWIHRIPDRQWKIGLTAGNCDIVNIGYGDLRYKMMYRRDVVPSLALGLTIKNIYPTFEQAVREAKQDKCLVQAFSRRFAVSKDSLYYKTFPRAVGEIKRNNAILKDNFFFLAEVLQQDLNRRGWND